MSISSRFYPLTVQHIRYEAAHTAVVSLVVPEALRPTFHFRAGQFVTLQANIDDQAVRRAYSICSSLAQYAAEGILSVGIKAVAGGVFSQWALTQLRAGDTLAVMPPDGRFYLPDSTSGSAKENVLCIAAGSGITPMLSLISSHLAAKPYSQFTLLYGNRTVNDIAFLDELSALKNRYPARLSLHYFLSQQAQDIALYQGRIDAEKLTLMQQSHFAQQRFSHSFICGPEGLINAAEQTLARLPNDAAGQIHTERFSSVNAPTRASTTTTPQAAQAATSSLDKDKEKTIALSITIDGKNHAFSWAGEAQALLDVGLAAGLDLPYACKGGVCCTCRAKVLEGAVTMDKNYTLEPWEVAQGFVLTCQCRPAADCQRVAVSFDHR